MINYNALVYYAFKLFLIAVGLNKSNPANRNVSAIKLMVAWLENKANSAIPSDT